MKNIFISKRFFISLIVIVFICFIYFFSIKDDSMNSHFIEEVGVLSVSYSSEKYLNYIDDSIDISISNTSDLVIGFNISLELINIPLDSYDELSIYLNDELVDVPLSEFLTIETNLLSKQYSNNDNIVYSLKIIGLKTGLVKININDSIVNNLATDVVKSLNIDDNSGLELVNGDLKYTALDSKNYLIFNDELWQIIGVFNININDINDDYLKITRVSEATADEIEDDYNNYLNNIKNNSKILNIQYQDAIKPQSGNDAVDALWLDLSYIRPTLYLTNNVKIIEGNGTINSPYRVI